MSRNDFILLALGIVVVLFVGGILLALLISYVKHRNKLVISGELDNQILEEYNYEKSKKAKALNIVNRVFDILICLIFLSLFAASTYAKINGNDFAINNVGSLKVVVSESMSKKNENNTYLVDNNLNNQFDMYDIIVVNELPQEQDLKLYDVVVYEKEGVEIVHRIIDIEEPNVIHPNERWFTLKGDANNSIDVKPVLYSQMKAIYSSKKIPFVGVFVLWLQSSLGYLVLLVILFYLIAEPIAVKKMKKVRDERILLINGENVSAEIKEYGLDVVDYPKSTPIIKILRDKYTLNNNEAKENAKNQLYKFSEILKLKEAKHPEKDFVLDTVNAWDLVNEGKVELYPETNKYGVKLDVKPDSGCFSFANNNDEGVLKIENEEQHVYCRHSLSSRLLLSDENTQRNFAYFEDLLKAFGAEEEDLWDKKVFTIGDIVFATFELDDQSSVANEEPATEINPTELATSENAQLVDNGDTGMVLINGKEISVRYDRSFTARVIQSSDEVKARYIEIKNYLLSYATKERMSWKTESFYKGRITYAKVKIVGKTLNVYLALNPLDYENTKYNFKNASDVKQYEATPMRLKIKSNRGVNWAKELIDDMMRNNEIIALENYENQDYSLEYEETKALISKGLIRVLIDGEAQNEAVTSKINALESDDNVNDDSSTN